MAKVSELTPEESNEVSKFLKERNLDIQINYAPQRVRRMEDGGFVIDPPQFNTKFVKIQKEIKDGNSKLETS